MPLSSAISKLNRLLGKEHVLARLEDVMLYEYDAGVDKGTPSAVLFPSTTEEVSGIIRIAASEGISVVPRGAGTGLSGGSIARDAGIVLVFTRMNRILEI